MAREIERKFLLTDAGWRSAVVRAIDIRQGYLAGNSECSVRVRLAGARAWLNIKSATFGIEREEFEYAIAPADGEFMLAHLCGERILTKTRHFVTFDGHSWEIDEFTGANRGLVVAELELASRETPFARPPWLGPEVSHERRYYNSCLVEHPYSTWSDAVIS